MKKFGYSSLVVAMTLAGVLASFSPSRAASGVATADPVAEAAAALKRVWESRADLQAIFGPDGKLLPAKKVGTLTSLEDWARRYGYKEAPKELAPFAPPGAEEQIIPAALIRTAAKEPKYLKKTSLNWGLISARAVYVVDDASHAVLLARNAKTERPLASLTKLMTARVALGEGLPMEQTASVEKADEVGGAYLRLRNGTPLTVRDLFYSMLVGSANDATNAVVRVTKTDKGDFVAKMNAQAAADGLKHTRFADPTGIEEANVSTAEEVAALAMRAFDEYEIRKATSTSLYHIVLEEGEHVIKNTNGVLTNGANGITVLAGKTGYLGPAVGWHLVTKVRDAKHPSITVVVMGSATQKKVAKDAERVAKWVWTNYRW